MRVLCVEDDEESREMMTLLLEQAGYEVVMASTATDGLGLARRGGFDLMLLDNWYEKGSGVELCKQIRRFDTHTPILFYSGAACESDIRRGMEAGAQGYLTKPTGIQVLVETIEELTHSTSKQLAALGEGEP
ncbi:MAG TPA: response regulator [Blastocatellia bacterium]|nr:response regulator [Blastocatellia bacterium]